MRVMQLLFPPRRFQRARRVKPSDSSSRNGKSGSCWAYRNLKIGVACGSRFVRETLQAVGRQVGDQDVGVSRWRGSDAEMTNGE
jgi:hypothetical protein